MDETEYGKGISTMVHIGSKAWYPGLSQGTGLSSQGPRLSSQGTRLKTIVTMGTMVYLVGGGSRDIRYNRWR